ncbi:KH domain-containing protein [Kitasatospora sp. NPDC059571]|uniref:KH domain-containing protein n=1 Tax=Kitasatospora sp. NPDC059571 TaxID=3346871 RepID=UPI00369241B6
MTTSIPVLLDVRGYQEVPTDAQGYRALWTKLEPRLTHVDPHERQPLQLGFGELGTVAVQLLDPEANPTHFGPDTAFAVRGILEPAYVRYICGTCKQHGDSAYGPFLCHTCKDEKRSERICDRHVVLLDGGLRALCPRHAPECECGQPGTYWCDGPGCRRRRAWCDSHRRHHPGDARTSYCPKCYAQNFPACSSRGCVQTGILRCEHVPPRDMCRNRVCASHAARWQIYGPHKRGLVLCPDHMRGLGQLSREDLIFQIVASTAQRSIHRRRMPARLPRLSVVRHIFINVRNEALDVAVLDELFSVVRRQLSGSQRDVAMASLMDVHAEVRQQDLARFTDEHAEGRRHFESLLTLLRADGQADLASGIAFSDYRPKVNKLFVRVPPDLAGLFIGRRGATIRSLNQRLGVTLELEKR